jgi:hypothetical protein
MDELADKGLKFWFGTDNFPIMAQVITSIIWGIIFSPWSYGLMYMIAYLIAYEIVFFLVNWWYFRKSYPSNRGFVVLAYFFGYLIGRSLVDESTILQTGLENDDDDD